jgi:hypothetical protein
MNASWLTIASLNTWWDALSIWQQVYWAIALFFGVLFILQYVVTLIGFGIGLDADSDTEGGHDHVIDPGFTWLSLRSIIAFFTFFGWSGVFLLARGASLWWTLMVSFFCGMLAMALVAYLLYVFARQTQIGNYFLREAVYQVGEVYLPIPAQKSGYGKIHVQIGRGLREVQAVTEGRGIPTGTRVRVVDLLEQNILLVEPLSPISPSSAS